MGILLLLQLFFLFFIFYSESKATGGELQSRISNGTLIIIPRPFEANLPRRYFTLPNIVLTQYFQKWMFLHQVLNRKLMETAQLCTPKTSSAAALQMSQMVVIVWPKGPETKGLAIPLGWLSGVGE